MFLNILPFLTFFIKVSLISADEEGGIYKYFPIRKEGLADDPKWFSQAKFGGPANNQKATPEDIHYFNYFSAAMYCEASLKDLSCKYCARFKEDVEKNNLIHNKTAETLALFTVSEPRKEIVITFRGSSNQKNFDEDSDTKMMVYANEIRLHRGFHYAVMSLYDRIVASIKSQIAQNPDENKYRIVVNGHSLGGSMAAIMTFMLNYNDVFPGHEYVLITFGEPREGNKLYVDYMNGLNITSARVVNKADASSHFTRTNELQTTKQTEYYLHRHIEYFHNGTTNVWCDQTVYEDDDCSNSMGPKYFWEHHLHYFDVDYLPCIADVNLENKFNKRNDDRVVGV